MLQASKTPKKSEDLAEKEREFKLFLSKNSIIKPSPQFIHLGGK